MIIYQQEFITYNDRSDRRWKIYQPEFSGQAFGLLSGKQDGAGLCAAVYERLYASGSCAEERRRMAGRDPERVKRGTVFIKGKRKRIPDSRKAGMDLADIYRTYEVRSSEADQKLYQKTGTDSGDADVYSRTLYGRDKA